MAAGGGRGGGGAGRARLQPVGSAGGLGSSPQRLALGELGCSLSVGSAGSNTETETHKVNDRLLVQVHNTESNNRAG